MTDCLKHFISDSDLEAGRMLNERFMTITCNKEGMIQHLYNTLTKKLSSPYYDEFGNKYDNKLILQYAFDNVTNEKGSSGSLAISLNTHMRATFIGIHGGGTRTEGLVIPTTRETLAKYMDKFPSVDTIEIPEPVTHSSAIAPSKYPNLSVVGNLDYVVTSPPVTAIVKTGISKHLKTPAETEPAILSDKDPRWQKALSEDPKRPHYAAKSILKYEGPEPAVDIDELYSAAANKARYMVQFFGGVRAQSAQESISGSELTGSKPLDRNTSPGLPYVNMGKKLKGKTEWLYLEPGGSRVLAMQDSRLT
jgi:hypothetical protein